MLQPINQRVLVEVQAYTPVLMARPGPGHGRTDPGLGNESIPRGHAAGEAVSWHSGIVILFAVPNTADQIEMGTLSFENQRAHSGGISLETQHKG